MRLRNSELLLRAGAVATGMLVFLAFAPCTFAAAPIHIKLPDYARKSVKTAKQRTAKSTASAPFVDSGWTKLDKDDYSGAAEDFTKALEADPKDADALCGRAIAYLSLGETDKGLDDLALCLTYSPDHPVALIILAMLSAEEEDFATAHASYRRAVKAYDKSKNVDASKQAKAKLAAIKVKDSKVHKKLGKMALKTPASLKTSLASAKAKAAKAKGAKVTTYDLVQNAMTKFDKGDNEGTITDCNEVLKTEPTNPWALCLKGMARLNLGQAEGLDDLFACVDANSDFPLAWAILGEVYLANGDIANAIVFLSIASDLYEQEGNAAEHQNAVAKLDTAHKKSLALAAKHTNGAKSKKPAAAKKPS